MDGSGALVGGDVVGRDAEDVAVEEGVPEGGAFERAAGEAGDDVTCEAAPDCLPLIRLQFAMIDESRPRRRCRYAVGRLDCDVFEMRVEGDGLRCGEGPRRRGPDDGVDLLACEGGVDRLRVACELVADVDAGAGVLLVLDFGFGERGSVVDAPVDGAQAFVDEVLFEEVVEGLDDAGLVAVRHGEVGRVPAAEDADALELGALEVDVFLRVFAAGAADGDGVHLEFFAAELLVDFDFDGETVAVPAGDVGGVEAVHGLGLDDEVLDALVEGVAEVDGSVGVGRAVVEDVFWGSGAGGADLGIQVLFLPRGEALGLIVRQIGLHGEGGLGQVQGGLQQLRCCVRGVLFPASGRGSV